MLFPFEKAPECGEKYLEALKKYPPDENLATEVVPTTVKSTLKGNTSLRIWDVKEGKLEESITYMARFLSVFRGIEGFSPSIDVYFKAEEAMANIGMSIPD
jgi:hypothetical protein